MTDRLSDKYEERTVSASISALLELQLSLKSYRDSLVLVGGWEPFCLLKEYGKDEFQHIGSIDIDLAVDPSLISQEEYATIIELIEERGYTQRIGKTGEPILFSYTKDMTSPVNGKLYVTQVDFLTSEMNKTKHRHRKVQGDLPARITKGCDLAFDHNRDVEIVGTLPDGAKTHGRIKVIDLAGCIGMKGNVLGERYKEKDAYDIFTVVGYCLGGVEEVADQVRPHMDAPSMRNGLENIADKFRSERAEGPTWTAMFLEPTSYKMRERAQAEVFITMQRFLRALNLSE